MLRFTPDNSAVAVVDSSRAASAGAGSTLAGLAAKPVVPNVASGPAAPPDGGAPTGLSSRRDRRIR